MSGITAYIVDDERLARQRLRRFLDGQPGLEILGEFGTAQEALDAFRERPSQLLFLDVEMPGMDGFALREAVRDAEPLIVFVTAHQDHAVRAFDVEAIDYLLKPFDEARVEKCLARVRSACENRPVPAYAERLTIRASGRVLFVRTAEIDRVEAADNYIVVHAGRDTHILRETMQQMMSKLDPARFVRVHRSHIVNIERVKHLQPYPHGEYAVILSDGTEVALGRAHREKLLEVMRGRG